MERKYFAGRAYGHHEGDPVVCAKCGATIAPEAPGTGHRNHCPACLWSRHVDLRPGDRSCSCRGLMEPIALWAKESGEVALVHRCLRCGALKANRLAGDDDEDAVGSIARRMRAATARRTSPH